MQCRLMNRAAFTLLTVATTICALVEAGCSTDPESPDPAPPPPESYAEFTGQLAPPDNFAVPASELHVLTAAATSTVGASYAFTAKTVKGAGAQLVMVADEATNPILLGYLMPTPGTKAAQDAAPHSGIAVGTLTAGITLDAESTALAILLMNPFLAPASDERRWEFATLASQHQRYPELVNYVRNVLELSPRTLSDASVHAPMYTMVGEIVTDTIAALQAANAAAVPKFSPDWLRDAAGPEVILRNPRWCHYAAGIHVYSSFEQLLVVPLPAREWSWFRLDAPVHEVRAAVGDGEFTIEYFKGFWEVPAGHLLDLNHPGGRATVANTLQGIQNIVRIFVSYPFVGSVSAFADILGESDAFATLVGAVIAGDWVDELEALAGFLVEEADRVYVFLFNLSDASGFRLFAEGARTLLGNVSVVLRAADAATSIPFFVDLATQPHHRTEIVRQLGGVLTELDVEAPSRPEGVACVAVNSMSIDISWLASSDNVGVTDYRLFRGGQYVRTVSVTSATDGGLSPSTEYCYSVSAVDAAGHESGRSLQACCTTPSGNDTEAPSRPLGLECEGAGSSAIDLTWLPSTDNVGVTAYRLYRGGQVVRVVTGTSVRDDGLEPGTAYCYRVTAMDGASNESPKSDESCCATDAAVDRTPPTVPQDPTCDSDGPTAMNVSWRASTDDVGVAGYRVYRDGAYVRTVPGTSMTDSGLQSSREYCYRVSAVDEANNESGKSAETCCTTDDNVPRIDDAHLSLPVLAGASVPASRYQAHRCMQSWTESGVTWANFPTWAISPMDTGTKITTPSGPVVRFTLLSSVVQTWVEQATLNYGIVVNDDTDGATAVDTYAEFGSRESAAQASRPWLDVLWYDAHDVRHSDRLYAVRDSYASRPQTGTNYGSASVLKVGWRDDTNYEYVAVLRFDLTTLGKTSQASGEAGGGPEDVEHHSGRVAPKD